MKWVTNSGNAAALAARIGLAQAIASRVAMLKDSALPGITKISALFSRSGREEGFT